MNDAQRPIFVAAAQLIQRDVEPAEALSPVAMLAQTARDAAEAAGAGARLLEQADTVGVVDIIGWRGANPSRAWAEAIGAKPKRELLTAVGGEIPLRMVNHVARRIAAGEARIAVLGGANNIHTLRRAAKARVKLHRDIAAGGEPERIGLTHPGSSRAEASYGLRMPIDIYPIFENALRARRGLDIETHRKRVGALMSRFSKVAASNPYAWYPIERSADEISIPSESNRMVAFPYTKYMNAVLDTDQAASVIMTSVAAARELGIPEDRWVHWLGGAHSQEKEWYPSERPDFGQCEALREVAMGALEEAAVGLDDVSFIDFYSCFPVAVEMACEMLGLDEDDPRGFTVTGGLPYAGGPGNNYTLHSLATLLDRVRSKPGSKGLVTGNGWYLTKHSATVVSTEPRPGNSWPSQTDTKSASVPDHTRSTDPARGRATLETYTVVFDRDGAPERGIVLGRTEKGRRFLANTPQDRELLESFVREDPHGRAGRVSEQDGINVFDPA